RWKSQLDLTRLLSGAGDLDLLVDAQDARTFLRIAKGLGFQRVVACFEPQPAEEVHLYGLDPETGALLHLHVNFSFGPRFPGLDELVLENAAPAQTSGPLHGMPMVQPHAELIACVLCTMEQYTRVRQYPHLLRKRESL